MLNKFGDLKLERDSAFRSQLRNKLRKVITKFIQSVQSPLRKMSNKVNVLVVTDTDDFFSKQTTSSLLQHVGANYAVQTVSKFLDFFVIPSDIAEAV